MPVTWSAGEVGAEPAEGVGFWSMTATECPSRSRLWASVEPTRPQPMITMCTLALSVRYDAYRATGDVRLASSPRATLHDAGAIRPHPARANCATLPMPAPWPYLLAT